MITLVAPTTTIVTPNPIASFAQLALNPRRYWLRAHQRAVARCRRLSAAYETAWRAGQPAWEEWQQLREADTRERFTYAMLCRAMGW